MHARKKEVIAEFADYRKEQLEDGRFSLFRSYGQFVDGQSVQLSDGTILRSAKILISTGSQVKVPNLPGLSGVDYKTSDDVLDLEAIPSECVVLGGGVVACELAQFLSRIGSRVTLLQRSPRLLKEFPREASRTLENALELEGLALQLGVNFRSFSQIDKEYVEVTYEHDGEEKKIQTSFLFLALGREPATHSLNLENVGVNLLPTGHIQTNSFQQTSLSRILRGW
jgi:pyruvate/2-oxoglutarate dehydrogenase complex dihydrolipoamide dehydrogenase (E3) component